MNHSHFPEVIFVAVDFPVTEQSYEIFLELERVMFVLILFVYKFINAISSSTVVSAKTLKLKQQVITHIRTSVEINFFNIRSPPFP